MENYDPQMAARVWQRVHKTDTATAGEANLPEMIAREWVDAQVCLQLSRRFHRNSGVLLRRIAKEKLSHADCLKGICALMTGTVPRVQRPPVPRDTVRQLLQRCCDSCIHCARQYDALSGDVQHGKLYNRLAEQSRQHCYELLCMLGKGAASEK